jgi:hypothetical protein
MVGGGKLWDIIALHPDAVVSICDVNFHGGDGTVLWIGVDDVMSNSGECPAKLHGLGWSDLDGVLIDFGVDIVSYQSRVPLSLGHASRGAEVNALECFCINPR